MLLIYSNLSDGNQYIDNINSLLKTYRKLLYLDTQPKTSKKENIEDQMKKFKEIFKVPKEIKIKINKEKAEKINNLEFENISGIDLIKKFNNRI